MEHKRGKRKNNQDHRNNKRAANSESHADALRSINPKNKLLLKQNLILIFSTISLIFAGALAINESNFTHLNLNSKVASPQFHFCSENQITNPDLTNKISSYKLEPKSQLSGACDYQVSRTKLAESDSLIFREFPTNSRQYQGPVILDNSSKDWYIHRNNEAAPELKIDQVESMAKNKILLLGDIIPARGVYYRQKVKGYDYPYLKVSETIKSADLALANFETTLTKNYIPTTNGMQFTAPVNENITSLKQSGIDGVNLANNHSFNGGPEGFVEMLKGFSGASVPYFGAGSNSDEAAKYAQFQLNNLKVGAVGFDSIIGGSRATVTEPGMNMLEIEPWFRFSQKDLDDAVTMIKSAKESNDFVVVYIHWSAEYTHDPSDQMRTVGKAFIDAGADVVAGTHPHWVQGYEWYNDKLITYSLGNFIFDQDWSPETMQGAMLELSLENSTLVRAEYKPYQILDQAQPTFAEGALADKIISDIQTSASKLK